MRYKHKAHKELSQKFKSNIPQQFSQTLSENLHIMQIVCEHMWMLHAIICTSIDVKICATP